MPGKDHVRGMSPEPRMQIELPGIPKVKSGKVREMFDLGETFLMVATDRISAFDCVLPNGIPEKGAILTRISDFWFDWLSGVVRNHRIVGPDGPFPLRLQEFAELIEGRSMVVRKAKPLPVECVVRGYLAGSGWKEYRENQAICGIPLPAGLLESDALPEPIFTPATKAESGHDENISFEQTIRLVGLDVAERVHRLSIEIYKGARDYAQQRGIIIADTKFEFGVADGELLLIDEVLTPDSSRFWPLDHYTPGRGQPSFDKQYVRDYLETLKWDKSPPAPALSEEVVRGTRGKYLEAYERLTERKWA